MPDTTSGNGKYSLGGSFPMPTWLVYLLLLVGGGGGASALLPLASSEAAPTANPRLTHAQRLEVNAAIDDRLGGKLDNITQLLHSMDKKVTTLSGHVKMYHGVRED